MDAATNAIYGRLTALLMQTDPWQVRFESLEEFVREYQRFPMQGEQRIVVLRQVGQLVVESNMKALKSGRLPSSQVAKTAVIVSCFDSATGGEVVGWQP